MPHVRYVEMRNTAAAIEAYRRALDITPRDYRAWCVFASFFLCCISTLRVTTLAPALGYIHTYCMHVCSSYSIFAGKYTHMKKHFSVTQGLVPSENPLHDAWPTGVFASSSTLQTLHSDAHVVACLPNACSTASSIHSMHMYAGTVWGKHTRFFKCTSTRCITLGRRLRCAPMMHACGVPWGSAMSA